VVVGGAGERVGAAGTLQGSATVDAGAGPRVAGGPHPLRAHGGAVVGTRPVGAALARASSRWTPVPVSCCGRLLLRLVRFEGVVCVGNGVVLPSRIWNQMLLNKTNLH